MSMIVFCHCSREWSFGALQPENQGAEWDVGKNNYVFKLSVPKLAILS